jgi:CRISPR/Cas system-associated endonuclease Cas1
MYLADIDCIIFQDSKTVLTTKLLNELAKNNIITIFCDETMMPISNLYPLKAKYNQLEIITKQLK